MTLNESDTRSKLIDPALYSRGWKEDNIKREETPGAVEMREGKARRRARGRMDYTLRVKVTPDSQPIAVALIEAKAEGLPAEHGLEQAKVYAESKRMNVPFVISTNGHKFVLFENFTFTTSKPRPMSEFPTPDELRAAYEKGMGFSLESELAKPMLSRYSGGEATRRYYQDAAIRATFEKIAKGENRALLALATGAGKTFIAVHLLKRIADAGQLRKALFICDRKELRDDLLKSLPDGVRSALLVRSLGQMDAYDLYDILAEMGYGLMPFTRLERAAAFTYKHAAWLKQMPVRTAETLRALALQFGRAGTEALESLRIFDTPEVTHAGGLDSLRALGHPAEILRETKVRLFAA